MTGPLRYPADDSHFGLIVGQIERALDTDRRLPSWPFRADAGNTDICQFSAAIEGPFGSVLQALVDAHGDTTVSLLVLEPTPAYYRENYGSYPGFMIPAQGIAEGYWGAVAHEPGGDPTGSVSYTANVIGIAGSTGAWAVWGERSWDLAIVVSKFVSGPWTSLGVTFVSAESALADFTEPDFKVPLPEAVRAQFLANVRARGTLK